MSGNPPDESLAEIIDGSRPATIEAVVAVMQKIDAALPSDDGLKWFNLLYLLVTKEVLAQQPGDGWADHAWITRLDTVFANLYFSAVGNLGRQAAATPSSWAALFEARHRAGIDRIQFALAGMNAHINRDLPLALVQTNEEFAINPGPNSRQHSDYERVNTILDAVFPDALQFLATGLLGEKVQDSGKIGRMLAMWNVRKARHTAWENSGILKLTERLPAVQQRSLAVLDKVTGVAGRGLLLPIQ